MRKLWDDMLSLLSVPVTGGLDVKHLFLLVGLTLVFISAWIMILNHFDAVAEEI